MGWHEDDEIEDKVREDFRQIVDPDYNPNTERANAAALGYGLTGGFVGLILPDLFGIDDRGIAVVSALVVGGICASIGWNRA